MGTVGKENSNYHCPGIVHRQHTFVLENASPKPHPNPPRLILLSLSPFTLTLSACWLLHRIIIRFHGTMGISITALTGSVCRADVEHYGYHSCERQRCGGEEWDGIIACMVDFMRMARCSRGGHGFHPCTFLGILSPCLLRQPFPDHTSMNQQHNLRATFRVRAGTTDRRFRQGVQMCPTRPLTHFLETVSVPPNRAPPISAILGVSRGYLEHESFHSL